MAGRGLVGGARSAGALQPFASRSGRSSPRGLHSTSTSVSTRTRARSSSLRAESVINVTGGLDDLASVMGSAASGFTMLHGGVAAVAIAPFVAKELAEAGLGKADAKRRLWRDGRLPAEVWRRTWLHERLIGRPPVAGLGARRGARGRDPRRRDPRGPRRPRRGRRPPHPAVRVFPLVGVPALPRRASHRAPDQLGRPARTRNAAVGKSRHSPICRRPNVLPPRTGRPTRCGTREGAGWRGDAFRRTGRPVPSYPASETRR